MIFQQLNTTTEKVDGDTHAAVQSWTSLDG